MHQQYKLDIFLGDKTLNPNIFKKSPFYFPKKGKEKVWKNWFIGIYEYKQIIFTNLIKSDILAKTNPVKNDDNNSHGGQTFHKYDAIIQVNQNKFIRLNQNKRPYNKVFTIANNIERFWGFSKQRFNKFNGINNYFEFHLKECEWRWKKSLKEMDRNLKKLLLIGLNIFVISHVLSDLKLQLIF